MSENLTFLAYRRPSLAPGAYRISVTQTSGLNAERFTTARTFTVAGERFTLAPEAVESMFPPPGSLGDHANVLPHIVLRRATMPWEREAGGPTGTVPPWLVLLLFCGDENPEPKVLALSALAGGTPYMPAPALDQHEAAGDKATVIDVPRALLAQIMPTMEDLPYLAHVRRRATQDDTAVVIGCRLPARKTTCTAHLVSVEGRYTAAGFDLGPDRPGALVRLVSLASWRFACVDGGQTFTSLASGLAGRAQPTLPESGDPRADVFLREGQVPVRHVLRQGGRTVSWYRGPLVNGPAPVGTPVAVRTSDALLRYHPDAGMLETGYAAAWQLGRLIALHHQSTASAMHAWKRRRAQRGKRSLDENHPLAVAEIETAMPDDVTKLFRDLTELRGVPLRYLVPDERLLPVESVRFFQLDLRWVSLLVDGAYSIGRVTPEDAEQDLAHSPPVPIPGASGAIIRSDLVSGYPGLLVSAYDAAGTKLDPLRVERLSGTIMLCLFKDVLARLDLHLPPEALHFAVELVPADRVGRTLRNAAGDTGPALSPLPLGPRAKIPISALVNAMATAVGTAFGPAEFARQMIESTARVSFLATGTSETVR
ncbi:hypothetical protein [Nonomuraea jabiensis]|uniref:Uncharacterized protein n=1 Tax=Nonomuraea jabiensis TaxID=882448 RepID=A0A7W9GE55_9ACTN|nr:hypothetical protein [Nonomuraea jabiensis]MBB5782132.1 hypothetical protein [Nonomuraea jabiensis]